jgi:glucose/mannose-6-phosphate isomerase
MNLNNTNEFKKIDGQNMLAQIEGLPEQLQTAWQQGLHFELPQWTGIRQVILAGMGGSAIGGDLLAAYVASKSEVPLYVHRDYQLPRWGRNRETLVIVSSHSGNTEETLSAYKTAVQANCKVLVITTGGKLANLAQKNAIPLLLFEHDGQPRAAIGFSFGLLLASFANLGFIPNPEEELFGAIRLMRHQQESIAADIPIAQNPAKRLAGQMIGRWVTIAGAGLMAPVARRWKTQINEIAKTWAGFEFLPEMDHNTLAGAQNPEALLFHTMIVFLNATVDYPRNRIRSEITKRSLMVEGLGTDYYFAGGDSALENLWTAEHFGDYVAYYLAMAYDVDPTPVDVIESFKREMISAEAAKPRDNQE